MPHSDQILKIREALSAIAPMEDEVFDMLVPLIRIVHMAKGEHFLRGGERAYRFGWVLKGVVRKYYVGPDGREHNSAFSIEGAPFGSFADIVSGEPSATHIDCLEDVTAAVVEWADLHALSLREPRWSLIIRLASQQLLASKTRRESEFLTLDAEERYRLMRKRTPEICARVPLYHLASHLGMRPEHLSRIRRKITRA